MRREFVRILEGEMASNEKIIVLTADIGFGVLDPLRQRFPGRVVNVGSSESLMIGIAVAYTYEGRIPVCYTITPFLLFRPFEMIRLYVDYERAPVKLVGCGRDKDYAHDGISHWAEDDVKIVTSAFPNIAISKPARSELTQNLVRRILYSPGPEYLNVTRG
jgi:transketolase